MARLPSAVLLLVPLLLAPPGTAGLPQGFPSVPIRGVSGEVAMPLYGLGTWLYNSSRADSAVEAAFKMGYRHVDTALVYENHKGVGAALQRSAIPRDEYFVTSKIPGGLSAAETTSQLDQCLAELGLSYVDLMLIHFPAAWSNERAGPEERREEWLALEAWAKAGKARAIGVSHYCRHHAEDVLAVSTVPIAVNQVQYHVGMGSEGPLATDDKAFFDKMGILYESFSPLCGPCGPPYDRELISGDLVTSIGRAHGKSGPQVALKWLAQQGIPVIAKTDSASHLRENMELFDFELSKEEMDRLSAATSPAVAGSGPGDSGDCSVGSAAVLSDQLV